MPATVRSVGVGNSSSTTLTSFSPAMPTGFSAGDLLIGIAGNGTGSVPSARPTGSTLIQNIDDGTVYNLDLVRKVAVGGDVFTWTVTTASKWAGCVIAITTGTYDSATPVSGATGAALGTTAAALLTTPSSTPANADSLVIAVFGAQAAVTWSTTNTTPSMVEICDTASSGTAAAAVGAYRSATAPAVAAMTRSATATLSTANGAAAILFVNPGTVAPAPLPYIRSGSQRNVISRATRW